MELKAQELRAAGIKTSRTSLFRKDSEISIGWRIFHRCNNIHACRCGRPARLEVSELRDWSLVQNCVSPILIGTDEARKRSVCTNGCRPRLVSLRSLGLGRRGVSWASSVQKILDT